MNIKFLFVVLMIGNAIPVESVEGSVFLAIKDSPETAPVNAQTRAQLKASEKKMNSPKTKLADALFRVAQARSEQEGEAALELLESLNASQNQFFSVKGGAAVAFGDFFVLVNGQKNRYLDAKKDETWTGASVDVVETVFIDTNLQRVRPQSLEDIKATRSIVFAKKKVYVFNFEDDVYGYYDRSSRRNLE